MLTKKIQRKSPKVYWVFFSCLASQTSKTENHLTRTHFRQIQNSQQKISKNKIEGTPILKMAMVKRLQVIKIFRKIKICHENLSQAFAQKFITKFRHKNLSQKFVINKKKLKEPKEPSKGNQVTTNLTKVNGPIFGLISVLKSSARPASGRRA